MLDRNPNQRRVMLGCPLEVSSRWPVLHPLILLPSRRHRASKYQNRSRNSISAERLEDRSIHRSSRRCSHHRKSHPAKEVREDSAMAP
jgi:hypothetical protein